MAILYVAANPNSVAYYLDSGGGDYQLLPSGCDTIEANFISVLCGMNEYFIRWNKELDQKFSDLDPDTNNIVDIIVAPSAKTKRPLPDPVEVRTDCEMVVKLISHQWLTRDERLKKLLKQVWQVTKNIDTKFVFIPKSENKAVALLK